MLTADAVVCWRLDRLGRNLRHVVLLLDEWQARGVAFVTLGEGIDTSTAAGRLVAGVLGSIAEFERARIQERIRAGLSRAKAQGTRLGRRRSSAVQSLNTCAGLSHNRRHPTNVSYRRAEFSPRGREPVQHDLQRHGYGAVSGLVSQ